MGLKNPYGNIQLLFAFYKRYDYVNEDHIMHRSLFLNL